MPEANNMIPDWFDIAIADGLQKLMALRLDNTPSADTILQTADVWVDVLWKKHKWGDELGGEAINNAFLTLAQNCTRWPSPSEFSRCLPVLPGSTQEQLYGKTTPEWRAHQKKHMSQLLAKLDLNLPKIPS